MRYRIAEDGELWIASPYLMSGYLDEPALQPIRDGWLATGDLARERDAGVVEIGGRKKELIYRGGMIALRGGYPVLDFSQLIPHGIDM